MEKFSVSDLERALDEGRDVEIKPNGSVVVGEPDSADFLATFQRNLGGEY